MQAKHSVKSVRIRSFSGQYFPAFGLNTERYGASPRIQSECGKIGTRKTPNTDTFHAVKCFEDVVPRYILPLENFYYFFFCCMKVIDAGPLTMEIF